MTEQEKQKDAKSHNGDKEGWVSSRLSNAQRWHHALFLPRFTTEFVGNLEPNLHRVTLSYIDAIHEHLLLDPVLLLWCNLPARLGPKLQCIRLRMVLAK